MENNGTFLARVKERVDFIYNLVVEQPDGYHGGFSSFDGLMRRISTDLVKRGILLKERDFNKPKKAYIYKWYSLAMAPTKQFYKTTAESIRTEQRRLDLNKKNKQIVVEKCAPSEAVIATTVEPEVIIEKPTVNPLEKFTSNELWDEIKRRGGTIEGNRLVIIRKEYLE